MGVSMLDPNRVAPVTADLTADDEAFEVLRGLETMKRVDKKLDSSTTDFAKGEWAVLGADDKVARATGTPSAASYPVWCGTDRTDVKATGAVTLIMNSDVIFKTTQYDAAQSYVPGSRLAVKAYATGKSGLTLAAANEPSVARVQTVGNGYLICEMGRG